MNGRGVNLISDALPFGRLWYSEVSDAIEPEALAATADRFTTAKNAR
jgi:hypothetical protein